MVSTYELIVSRLEELSHKLEKIPIESKIHLPDKPNAYPNIQLVKHIINKLGLTFSVGNHYNKGNFNLIITEFNKYLEIIKNHSNVYELLIVSGSNSRKINVLSILEYLKDWANPKHQQSSLIVSVAYNCNSNDQIKENEHLIKKLKYGVASKVYIQITDEIKKVVSGINFIHSLNPKLIICVCVFEPTKLSLAKFIFRPWKGIVLSSNFLSNFQTAADINKQNMEILQKFNVEYVITN